MCGTPPKPWWVHDDEPWYDIGRVLYPADTYTGIPNGGIGIEGLRSKQKLALFPNDFVEIPLETIVTVLWPTLDHFGILFLPDRVI
jgi:hypothetical protein